MWMIRNQHSLAVAAILFSSTMWGLIWYPMRWLERGGMTVVWATLFMYLFAAVVISAYGWRQRRSASGAMNPELWLLAIAAGATNIAFLMALIEGTVVRVMLLFYLSPLWSVLIGRWWLGECLSALSLFLVTLAMSGTVLMLWQPKVGLPWPQSTADWLALFASVSFSINNVLGRKLAAEDMITKLKVVFWGVVVVSALVLIGQQSELPQVDFHIWLATMMMGVVIIAMTVSVLFGLALMPIYRSAIIMLFELVVAAISAWLLTNEHMSMREWSGGVLIIMAAYGIALMEKARD